MLVRAGRCTSGASRFAEVAVAAPDVAGGCLLGSGSRCGFLRGGFLVEDLEVTLAIE
jgi:hypothetical protein